MVADMLSQLESRCVHVHTSTRRQASVDSEGLATTGGSPSGIGHIEAWREMPPEMHTPDVEKSLVCLPMGVVCSSAPSTFEELPTPLGHQHSFASAVFDLMLFVVLPGTTKFYRDCTCRQVFFLAVALAAVICLCLDIAGGLPTILLDGDLSLAVELVCCIAAVLSLWAGKIGSLLGSSSALMDIVAGDLASAWKRRSCRLMRVPLSLWTLDVALHTLCYVWPEEFGLKPPVARFVSAQLSSTMFTAILACQMHAGSHLLMITHRFCEKRSKYLMDEGVQ